MDFDLLQPKSLKAARLLLEEHYPDVVLASTHQAKGHGLSLCTRLRKYQGGDCLMVVHGAVPDSLDGDRLRADMDHTYKVDHWLHNNASPALVALTVKQLLKAHQSGRPARRRSLGAPLSMSTPSEETRPKSDAKLRTTGEFEVEFKRPPTLKRER